MPLLPARVWYSGLRGGQLPDAECPARRTPERLPGPWVTSLDSPWRVFLGPGWPAQTSPSGLLRAPSDQTDVLWWAALDTGPAQRSEDHWPPFSCRHTLSTGNFSRPFFVSSAQEPSCRGPESYADYIKGCLSWFAARWVRTKINHKLAKGAHKHAGLGHFCWGTRGEFKPVLHPTLPLFSRLLKEKTNCGALGAGLRVFSRWVSACRGFQHGHSAGPAACPQLCGPPLLARRRVSDAPAASSQGPPVSLLRELLGQRSLLGCGLWGCTESRDWATDTFTVCMCHVFFIHSSVSGYIGCFYALAIVKGAAMSIGVYVSFWIIVLSRYVTRSGMVRACGNSINQVF